LRGLVAVAAVALALLLPVANPGSGTAVNLHDVDAASIVRGDHHAKTLPTVSAIACAVLLVALAARTWRQLVSPPATPARVAHVRDDLQVTWPGTGILARAVLARRGPPACA
jgi:hypothetical protein